MFDEMLNEMLDGPFDRIFDLCEQPSMALGHLVDFSPHGHRADKRRVDKLGGKARQLAQPLGLNFAPVFLKLELQLRSFGLLCFEQRLQGHVQRWVQS